MQTHYKRYQKIIVAIPHCIPGSQFCPNGNSSVVGEWSARFTDWFTDELFGQEIDGVTTVKSKMSRLDCDVERLEHEKDRLWLFEQLDISSYVQEWARENTALKNKCLSNWYQYRADILCASCEEATIIVDAHSFPCDIAPDIDICIGFNEDESRPDDATIERVADIFKDAGYSIGFNHPFANAIAPMGYYGHSIMIEVNKSIYMNEVIIAKKEDFEKLKATIRKVYCELLDNFPWQIASQVSQFSEDGSEGSWQ